MRAWSEILAELEARHRAWIGPRWHLVQVMPRARDRRAVERLGREYETYYPLERSWRLAPLCKLSRRQREAGVTRMVQTLRPMFPRYVFTRFDPADDWHAIFCVAGVTGLVLRHGQPVPIADDLIATLKAAEVNGAIPGATPAASVFRLGQWVEIESGPFANLRGAIERIRTTPLDGIDAALRLTVVIELFGRLTPVEVDAAAVRAQPSH